VENEPDLVRCDYLLNEGGGEFSPLDDGLLYPVTVGEKAYAEFRITTRGQGGHGSVPLHDRNAVEKMARVITALADHDLEALVGPLTAAYIDVLIPDDSLCARLKDPASARAAIADMHAAGDPLAYAVEPLLGITFSPTVVRTGSGAGERDPIARRGRRRLSHPPEQRPRTSNARCALHWPASTAGSSTGST
jgi:acetylornithine deacetylase/succinyl-diaminopimelate desuccinylase-like protein